MGRKKRATSRRSQKRIDDLYADTLDAVIDTVSYIKDRLKNRETVSDEMIRFLKTSPQTVRALQAREVEVDKAKEPELPPGKLREFIERVWRLKDLGIFTRADEHKVLNKAGYVYCDFCGYFHRSGDACPFKALKRNEPISTDTPEEESLNA